MKMNTIINSLVNLFFKKKEAEQAGNNQTVKDTVQKFYEKDIDLFSDTSTASQDASNNKDEETLTDLDRLLQNKPTNIETFLLT